MTERLPTKNQILATMATAAALGATGCGGARNSHDAPASLTTSPEGLSVIAHNHATIAAFPYNDRPPREAVTSYAKGVRTDTYTTGNYRDFLHKEGYRENVKVVTYCDDADLRKSATITLSALPDSSPIHVPPVKAHTLSNINGPCEDGKITPSDFPIQRATTALTEDK